MKRFIAFVKYYYIEPAKTVGFWIYLIVAYSIFYWITKGF